ncbi:hypothetical protein D3C80_2205680 [compost metagenome]
MLVANGEQAFRFLGLLVPVEVLIADFDAGVAFDLIDNARHGNATFLMMDLFL